MQVISSHLQISHYLHYISSHNVYVQSMIMSDLSIALSNPSICLLFVKYSLPRWQKVQGGNFFSSFALSIIYHIHGIYHVGRWQKINLFYLDSFCQTQSCVRQYWWRWLKFLKVYLSILYAINPIITEDMPTYSV